MSHLHSPGLLERNPNRSQTGGVVVTQNFLELHDLVGPGKAKVLSTVTAIYDVGCFLGAIVAFTIGERLGRKKSIILGSTIMSIGVILQAASFSLGQMFVGRIVLGLVPSSPPPPPLFLTVQTNRFTESAMASILLLLPFGKQRRHPSDGEGNWSFLKWP